MSSNKVTMITMGNLNPEADKHLQKYAQIVTPLLENAGGKPMFRLKHKEMIVGNDSPSIILGMEFPNEESVQKVFASSEYQEAVQYRDLAFSKINVIVGEAV